MNNPLSFADGASCGANPLRTARDRFAPLGPGAPSTCTAKRASALARSGWLLRLGRGAYGLPGDNLQRDACLAFLAQQVPGLHVAGKTALVWRGVRHNLAYRETVVLWGDQPARLSRWLDGVVQVRYRVAHIFDADLPAVLGLAPLAGGHPGPPVFAPVSDWIWPHHHEQRLHRHASLDAFRLSHDKGAPP